MEEIFMETFLLNMQLLGDAFSSVYQHVTLFSDSDPARLEAVRLYDRNRPLGTSYLYLLYSDELVQLPDSLRGLSFLVAGKIRTEQIPADCSLLVVEDEASIPELFNLAQDTFELYTRWNQEPQAAMERTRHTAKRAVRIFFILILLFSFLFSASGKNRAFKIMENFTNKCPCIYYNYRFCKS